MDHRFGTTYVNLTKLITTTWKTYSLGQCTADKEQNYDIYAGCVREPVQWPYTSSCIYISGFANNALFGDRIRIRVGIREQRKIKRISKALLRL